MATQRADEREDELFRRCRDQFVPETICELDGNVEVWWMPREFSQSKLGNFNSGSNACTLIAVLVALKCYNKELVLARGLRMENYERLLYIFGSSIIEGNKIHEDLQRTGDLHDVNLTIPEAIRACNAANRIIEWKSFIYLMDMRESLYKEMNEKLVEFLNESSLAITELFVTLITENRTVLFIFKIDTNLVTLIDSHQHIPHGASAAQTSLQHLDELCLWYDNVLRSYYRLAPNCYELTYLYMLPEAVWT